MIGPREARKTVVTLESHKRWLELKLEQNLRVGGSEGAAGHAAQKVSALGKAIDCFVGVHGLDGDAELAAKIAQERAKQDETFALFGAKKGDIE